MMRRYALTMALLVLGFCGLNAQQVLKLGSGNLTLEDNVGVRGRALPVGAANHEQLMVLRFDNLPTAKQKAELRRQGIELHSYISHNIYYATVKGNPSEALLAASRGRAAQPRVRQANAVEPAWKVSPEVSSGRIPEWARAGKAGMARIVVEFFKGTDAKMVAKHLNNNGIRLVNMLDKFYMAQVEMPVVEAQRLAENSWVRWIDFVSPPMEPDNAEGRSLSRTNVLSQAINLGGYGLTGKGQDVGLWDGNVESHPDFGNRLVVHEFEYPSDHGQHTAGSLAGAGILDPRAKGMAPEATLHTWNFNTQSNGLSVPEEMYISAAEYNVRLTSNSYGVYMTSNGKDVWCVNKYTYTSSDAAHDRLTNEQFPDLLHIFSGGNDQDACLPYTGSRYETTTKRVKNSVLVAALEEDGSMSSYSSWGPMDDGRMVPHIAVSGSSTYSTVYGMGYGLKQGTSMACPTAAGTMTLLYQLYQQIHGHKPLAALAKAVMLNSGHDRGNVGPDYQYGFGVLDGLRSARMIEKKQHFVDTVDNGGEKTFSINVPAGTAELRVMLVWSDVPANPAANPALVNDLDLTVEQGGIAHLPWRLNPKYPELPATKGYDRLNNHEQVTIANPAAGTYTIKVEGYAIPEGPQEFAIAYDCIAAGVELTYPNGGETFAPKAEVLARWSTNGMQEPITIELSTDGGATFITLASNIEATQTDALLSLPDVSTGQALMRIRQGNATDVSKGAFNIMGVPTGLAVQAPSPCDASGYSLVWNPVPGAAQYAVFKVDEAKGIYTELGRTADTAYTLPTLGAERNIFSISAVSAEGSMSERSVAVMATPSLPMSLATLPLRENFEQFLSPYFTFSLGEHVVKSYTGTMYEKSPAQMVRFSGTGNNAAWSSSADLFDANPSCVAKAQICSVDATQVEGSLWLRLAAVVNRSSNGAAAFRVVVNGIDVIADNLGRTSVSKLDEGNISYYDLSAYADTTFSLSIEAVLRTADDWASFGHIELWQPEHDVQLLSAELPASPVSGTSAALTINVFNNSPQVLTNLPVRYRVNGGAAVTEMLVGPVRPFCEATYTFERKVVLAEADVLYTVEAEVLFHGDQHPDNNMATARAYRDGTGGDPRMLCGTTNLQLTATSTPQYFTDNGGRLGDYANSCTSALTITSENVGKKVQLRVLECDIEEDWDYLYVYDGDNANAEMLFELTGSNIVALQSTNGTDATQSSLYARFVSDENTTGAGFVIEYMEVDAGEANNTFTLVGIENGNGNYLDGQPVSIKLMNNGVEAQSNVRVRYRYNDADWVEDTIASLAVGESTYTFAKELRLDATVYEVKLIAEVVNSDDMSTDNVKKKTIYNDYYCVAINNTLLSSDTALYVRKIACGGVSFTMQRVPRYPLIETRSTVFHVYQDVASNQIEITLPKALAQGQVGLWIDWNDDYVLDDAEGQVQNFVAGQTVYTFDIDPSGQPIGVHNMRVRVGTFAVTPCADALADGQYGQTVDFSLEVSPNYPVVYDIELVDIIAQSGINLGSSERVNVMLTNKGNKEVSNISLNLVVDGHEVASEIVSAVIAPGDTVGYAFVATADLSAIGNHTIEVMASLDGDENPFNNSKTVSLLHAKDAATGESWMLSFDGNDDVVNAGTLNGANLQSFTYEAWINPNSCGGYGAGAPGFGRVFEGKGLSLFANGLATSTFYPMNCFVVSIDNGGSYCTAAETFKIGQWQHIAVSHDSATHEVKIYINGQQVWDSTRTAVTAVANNAANNLLIGNGSSGDRQFDGKIDNARVWRIVRTASEIATDMNTATSLSGTKGLVAEFLFNEGVHTNTVTNTADGSIAAIINANCAEGKQSIWQRYDVLRAFAVEGQVAEWQQTGSNSFIAEVESGYDIAALTPIFTTQFEGAVVSANGNAITSGVGAIDFSSPVTVSATYNHLGEDIVETYTFAIASQSKLLSFELPAAGYSVSSPVPSIIEIETNGAVNALVTNYTLSAPGTVLFNGVAQASGAAIDYSSPVIIDVLGASGAVNATYTVLLKQQHTISWGSVDSSYTYGDPSFALSATSSLGARLVYESSNPSVISIDGGRAYIVGAGTATISTKHPGGQGLQPATAAETHTISVAKAKLHIYADTLSIAQSAQLPELTMSFSGFVNADDASKLNELPTPSTDAVVGTAGLYTISLAGGSDDNYDYVLHSAPLTIEPQEMYALTIGVTASGNSAEGASIELNGQTFTTDASGRVSAKLPVGNYAYSVQFVGYETYADSVRLTADASLNVSLRAAQYIPITYTTDGHGTLVDTSGVVTEPQLVVPGQNTEPVQVLAHNGYNFVQWSDGRTDNPRQDYNVLAPATYTAQFAIKTFTVNYSAGVGGSISGQALQTVEFGQSGTEVTAVADAGYLFKQWSDGHTSPTRTDSPVEDMAVEAEFDQVFTVPYTQTFNENVAPAYWRTANNTGGYAEWTFAASAYYNEMGKALTISGSTPNCAVLNDLNYKGGANADADLISPLFDFTNLREVTLKFNHYHYNRYNIGGVPLSSVSLYYSVDGGDWTLIKQWQGTTPNPEEFEWTTMSDEICNHTAVRFKFNFFNRIHASYGSYAGSACWIVDDFKVTGIQNADSYTVTYRAGKGGSLQSVNVNAEGVVTEVVNDGDNGPSVTAVADAGYVFVGWSDGISDNPRQDVVNKPIDVTALFQLDCGMPISSLPWRYSFESDAFGHIPEIGCWNAMANVGGNSRYGWSFEDNQAEFYYMGTGLADGTLISPLFDLSAVAGEDVYVSFKSLFFNYNSYDEDVYFEYSDDDGASWNQLWICDRTAEPYFVSGANKYFLDTVLVQLPTVTNTMRFRWTFMGYTAGDVAGYWDVSDIEITTSSMGLIEYTSNDDGRYYLGVIEHNGQYNAKQRIIEPIGTDITVEAIPYIGYHFDKWSDGNKNTQRIDQVAATPQSYMAEFVIDTFLFTYTAGANGALSMKNVEASTYVQSITYRGTGDTVTAIADLGYKFVRWSDGRADNPRIDTDVRKDSSVVAMFDALRLFNIAATATPAEYGEVTGEGSYLEGEMVTLNATAKDGSAFVRWTSNGVTVSTANPFTFVATSDSSLVAEFDVAQFNLIYSATMGGYIDGQARQTISYGQNGTTVEAKPVEGYGYHFVQWSDGLAEAARTSTNVTADQLLVAQFAPNSYVLSYTAGEYGTLSGTTTQTVVHGQSGSMVEAVANQGYEFKQWSDGSTVNPRTDVNVCADLNLTAIFGCAPVTHEFAVVECGSYTWDGDVYTVSDDYIKTYTAANGCDSTVTLHLTINQPVTHEFAVVECGSYTWDGDVYTVSDDYIKTYTAANGCDSTVTLHLTINQPVTHEFAVEVEGSYDWNGVNYTVSGDYMQTFTAANGCDSTVMLHLTITGSVPPATEIHMILATANPAEAGSITGAGQYELGATATLEATANEGYRFVQWNDGETANPYSFEVAGDVNLVAEFEVLTYNLAYTAGVNGSLQGELSQTVAHGQSGTAVEAVAENGFKFLRWSDGRTDNPRTDTNVREDVNVEAEFVAENVTVFTLSYTALEGGSISGAAQQTVAEGGNGLAVTAVADKGYRFVQWSDGSTNATRTEENVTEDMAFEAEFIRVFRVDYLAAANGSIEGAALQNVDLGSSTTAVTAVPAEGYRFVDWSDGVTEATRTDVVDDDLTVVARFELIRYILTINVIDANANPIAFAKVKIGEKELKANDKGMAVDTLVPDRYSYTVECEGYDAKSGEVVLTADTLVKVALSKTTTSVSSTSIESLSVYPNPTMGGIYVEGNGDVVSIISMGAQLVLQQPVYGRTYVDLSTLPAGMYIVRLGNAQAKVIKQ